MDSGSVMEKWVQISMANWRLEVNTFEDIFFGWVVHLYGLPYPLWSSLNLPRIGNAVGKCVALDPHSINFTRLDAVTNKIRIEKSRLSQSFSG